MLSRSSSKGQSNTTLRLVAQKFNSYRKSICLEVSSMEYYTSMEDYVSWTGKATKRIYPSNVIQLAANTHLWEVNHPDTTGRCHDVDSTRQREWV